MGQFKGMVEMETENRKVLKKMQVFVKGISECFLQDITLALKNEKKSIT